MTNIAPKIFSASNKMRYYCFHYWDSQKGEGRGRFFPDKSAVGVGELCVRQRHLQWLWFPFQSLPPLKPPLGPRSESN